MKRVLAIPLAFLFAAGPARAQQQRQARQSSDLPPRKKDVPTIARGANGTVVSLVMSGKDGHAVAQGSGFLISKNGRIVTNYHVIENGSSAIVKLP